MKEVVNLLKEVRDVMIEICGVMIEIRDLLKAQAERTSKEYLPEATITAPESEVPQGPDPLDVVRYLEEREGWHEVKNKSQLMAEFEKYNIRDHRGEVFDPVRDYWCGAMARCAVVAAGFEDPGVDFNKASNWERIGQEVDYNTPGAFRVYNTHISFNATDGENEIGGNTKDSIFKSAIDEAWFGKPLSCRILV